MKGQVGMLSGRALAVAILGWSFVKVVGKLLFTKQSPGLAQFHENYGSEGLVPIEPVERERLEKFSGCIACGRCDIGEADRIIASGGRYPGLMQTVLASTRSMPDYDAAAEAFDHVPVDVLAEKEAVCPVGIPFTALAQFVRDKAPVSEEVSTVVALPPSTSP